MFTRITSRAESSRMGLLALPLAATLGTQVLGSVALSPIFSDHMVLQRGMPVPVWGTAGNGEKVTVTFGGKSASAVTINGEWSVRLPALEANAVGADLTVHGSTDSVVHDVVVGEVWVCSGQSNMEWPLRASYQAESDIQNSANPNLRVFQVAKRRSYQPKTDLAYAKHAWAVAGPDAVRDFSAVGYYFGRDLQADLKVPVGIIHTSWGGSPAEVWMSMGTLRRNHIYNRDILDAAAREQKNYDLSLVAWAKEKAAAEAKGEKFTKGQPWPPWSPAELYNGQLLPIVPYAIKGALWYQGESNAGHAWQYRDLFADMIKDWRHIWHEGDFPFYAVQLAPWDGNKHRSIQEITAKPVESAWAELRDAQNYVAATLPNVKVAVITDVGDKDDIHPTKKVPVGHRLALLAEKNVYHLKVVDHGPDLNTISYQGKELHLRFENVGNGLKTIDGGAPTGFAIAGTNGVYHWADAKLSGKNEVVLSSTEVPEPKTIRYGWADYPVVNLANSSDLPASPFRTDKAVYTTAVIH